MSFAIRLCTAVFLLVGLSLNLAFATDYPNRPIRWIVPYPPAGTTDVLARIVAQRLSETLGQQVVVENKPGAGNNIGTELVINAPPDGYTMLLVNPANGINASLYKNLSFNFIRDIAPVAGLVRTPNVMVITNNLPVKTVAEFIDYCKANPGKVNMASSGNGTSTHLSGELFKVMTGCNMLHIPYKGSSLAMPDLISGKIQVIFDSIVSGIQHVEDGKLTAIAVTGKKRSPLLPNVPTLIEIGAPYGLDKFVSEKWWGLYGPKNLPKNIVDKLNTELNKVLQSSDVKEQLAKLGAEPGGGTPKAFKELVLEDRARWAKIIKDNKITID